MSDITFRWRGKKICEISKIQKPQKMQKRWLLSENSKFKKRKNGGCSQKIQKFKNRKNAKTVVALGKIKNSKIQPP